MLATLAFYFNDDFFEEVTIQLLDPVADENILKNQRIAELKKRTCANEKRIWEAIAAKEQEYPRKFQFCKSWYVILFIPSKLNTMHLSTGDIKKFEEQHYISFNKVKNEEL